MLRTQTQFEEALISTQYLEESKDLSSHLISHVDEYLISFVCSFQLTREMSQHFFDNHEQVSERGQVYVLIVWEIVYVPHFKILK